MRKWVFFVMACFCVVLPILDEHSWGIEPLFAQSSGSTHTRAGAVFKYKDKEGNLHIGHSVPPENVQYGYEVIDRYGQVIERVERSLSEKEIQSQEAAESEAMRRAKRAKERRQKDIILLKTFSSPVDAERARDRKLAALDVIIDITKGNILRLNLDYEDQQKKAAEYERVGNQVPEEVYVALDGIQAQLDEAFRFVKIKEAEKEAVYLDYAADIERLKELRGTALKKDDSKK